ncbi:MAG: GNAT family N-acetyltransferase [Lachnospiraceae bacterium]|nr:GNAT family N-acetyltransferase [Lachnospiraceae bacterium]
MVTVREGKLEDIPQVAQIYDHILEGNGNEITGWIKGVYPTEQTAREALEAGELFVMEENGAVVAAAKINQEQVPEYKNASWIYKDILPEQIMVLHTLVVDPTCAGKGYGTEFVNFYEEYAMKHHCPYLRMDTNAKNVAARRLYTHLGYKEVGIVPCVFNGIPNVQLVCLEKKLEL